MWFVTDAAVGDPACPFASSLTPPSLPLSLFMSVPFLYLFFCFLLLSFANLVFMPCLLQHNIHIANKMNNKIK